MEKPSKAYAILIAAVAVIAAVVSLAASVVAVTVTVAGKVHSDEKDESVEESVEPVNATLDASEIRVCTLPKSYCFTRIKKKICDHPECYCFTHIKKNRAIGWFENIAYCERYLRMIDGMVFDAPDEKDVSDMG